MAKKLTYTIAQNELKNILEEIQSGDISIDDLSSKLKRAKELVLFCKVKLRTIEEEIDALEEE